MPPGNSFNRARTGDHFSNPTPNRTFHLQWIGPLLPTRSVQFTAVTALPPHDTVLRHAFDPPIYLRSFRIRGRSDPGTPLTASRSRVCVPSNCWETPVLAVPRGTGTLNFPAGSSRYSPGHSLVLTAVRAAVADIAAGPIPPVVTARHRPLTTPGHHHRSSLSGLPDGSPASRRGTGACLTGPLRATCSGRNRSLTGLPRLS